jgi:hypothetical protein
MRQEARRMTEKTDTESCRRVRLLAWGASATLIILPLLAMKLVDRSAWELGDLPFAFLMIAAVGLAYEFALRVPTGRTNRAGAALAIGTAFLLTWGNLAVGFAGSEENAINIIFFAVPAVALVGSLAAGFRSAGLATAMAGAAVAQFTAGSIALYFGYFTGPLTVTFTGLWLASSLLFLRTSRVRTADRATG